MTAPENVLWIGGRSGAGKSTVARLLARKHGLRWYSCDTRTWEHRDRAIAAGDDAAIEWEGLTPQQRSRLSPADAIRLAVDRSAMVLADVAVLPDRPAVVVEGTPIVPSMVPPQSPAIWLLTRPEVRSTRTTQRGWGAGGGEVDVIKERELLAELDNTELTKNTTPMIIDNSFVTDVRQTLAEIEKLAGSWLRTVPVAAHRTERQSLIRQGNAAIVAQYRGGMARAGNTAGGGLVRSYDCECGDTGCTALIERSLDSLPDPFLPSSEPILATGHRQ